jgi:two-component system sensor histidine kinase PilS (NtrC family)
VQIRGQGPYSEQQLTAFYALVLTGFLLALAWGVVAVYGREKPRLTAAELFGDLALITAFVYCSGGVGSFFGFLYIVWIVHASARAGPRGTVYASGAAIVSYGVVSLGTAVGAVPTFADVVAPPFDEAATSFGMHAAAFLSVTLLARRLEREVEAGQHELMELGEIHQRIVDNVSSGLLTVDEEERITSFNHEAERITGHAMENVLGQPLGELFAGLPDEARGAVGPESGPTRAEAPFVQPNGELLHLGFSRSVLRDTQGQPDGAILIFQDLTRVRQMEEQLRRSERMSIVGQLATGLAHEIRNPLASLSGAIELLGSDLPGEDASSRRLLRIVERETARLDRLVSDFLSYAAGREPQREAVPLLELLQEIGQLLASGGHASAALELDVPAELFVVADPDQLRQVFWNLILNAIQASGEGQRVRVCAAQLPAMEEAGERRVRVQVEDRGVGIPADQLERAFEPFFTTRAKGTGLGLATVHRIIEAHGGELSISSEPGRGTTVSVVLEQARRA